MSLFLKMIAIPFISYGLLLPTAAIMGGIYEPNELKELLGGTSAMPIWFTWMVVLVLVVPTHHFFSKKFKKDVDKEQGM